MKQFKKKNLILKEEDSNNRPNVAADTSSTNATPQQIVNDTRAKNTNAGSVTIPGNEIDGNSDTQTSTIEVGDDAASLDNARRMASTLGRQGQNVDFKVQLHNSKQITKPIVEGVQFTKKELTDFLRSI